MTSVTSKWSVRVPETEDLEKVLNEMSNDGWVVYKMSEPVCGSHDKVFILVVFQKSEYNEDTQ